MKIKSFCKEKGPAPGGFTGEFYQKFKEEIIQTIHKFFQKIKEERTLPNSFYEANTVLILKPDKNFTRKVNCRPISLMNMDKIFSTK